MWSAGYCKSNTLTMTPHRRSVHRERIGVITQGSLSKGVEMKLSPNQSVESVKAGTFLVIQGNQYDFFSLITDVVIAATNENILLNPPGPEDHLLRQVMQGTAAYAKVHLHPMLMLENDDILSDEQEPRAVKTVPVHFSDVAQANKEDVARIFGDEKAEDGKRYFHIGSPLGMDHLPLCIDLHRFVERSNAVFGKTGTGKTFLTRLLLCGLIKTDVAANLIFDMHAEYGDSVMQESATGENYFLDGLKELFPTKVEIFSLDSDGARERGAKVDHSVTIYADQIRPEDILPLQDTLNLTSTAPEVCHALRKKYGKRWLIELLDSDSPEELEKLAEDIGAHEGALGALQRKLSRFKSLKFFTTTNSRGTNESLKALMSSLQAGKSVVFEFGRYNSLHVYLLVANVVTRLIRDHYEKLTNKFRLTRKNKPKPLMITIEEAHKFLSSGAARETPFGKIAREMRKYFVSLLVVDQRPSAIDEEVLSQIGTKIVAQLSDDKDLGAVLVGERGGSNLRHILAALDSKRQALLMGHATPMPMVIHSRSYDSEFFGAMKGETGPKIDHDALADLFG